MDFCVMQKNSMRSGKKILPVLVIMTLKFPTGPDSDATSVCRLHLEEQMHTDILTLYHENMVKMHTCILMW